MPVSAEYFKRRIDAQIQQYGQLVSVYAPVSPKTPEPVALAGTTHAMLQFGEKARDAATLAGVDSQKQTCVAYFLSSSAALALERNYVKDASGGWWLVKSRPNAQPAPTTIGIGMLLVRQIEAPNGA